VTRAGNTDRKVMTETGVNNADRTMFNTDRSYLLQSDIYDDNVGSIPAAVVVSTCYAESFLSGMMLKSLKCSRESNSNNYMCF